MTPTRRRFLHRATTAVATTALPMIALPARGATTERRLAFVHTHTGERLALAFARGEQFLPEALGQLNRFLRDHYTGQIGNIDPALFDLLFRVQRELGHGGAFEVISGFRGSDTNERLRRSGAGGVARHSLHMDGRAIDVRLPEAALTDLRDAALSLHGGGVGFYPRERFVHLDTGRVRAW